MGGGVWRATQPLADGPLCVVGHNLTLLGEARDSGEQDKGINSSRPNERHTSRTESKNKRNVRLREETIMST